MTISLDATAGGLVSAVNQAKNAIIGLDSSLNTLQKTQISFNSKGDVTIRLQEMDAAGNKAITTFKEVDGIFKAVATTVKTATSSFANFATTTTAAAEANQLLAQASAIGAEGIRAQANAFAAEATAAQISADKLAASALASERKAETTLNSANATRAAEAAEDKFIRSAIEAQAAQLAGAEASKLSAVAALAEAEALTLRNKAASVVAQGQRATALSGLNEEQARKAGAVQAEAKKQAADFREAQQKLAAQEFADQKKISAERIADAKAIEAERLEGEEKVAVAAFKAQKKISAERIADAKAIEAERIEGEEKVAAQELVAQKKVTTARIRDAELISAETKKLDAQKEKDAQKELTRNAKVAAARIREAELILAETKKLQTSFERVFQTNLKITKAQAAQKQQTVLTTAQAEKQVGLYARSLILLQEEAAALATINAVPLARGRAAQDGTDAFSLKVIRLKAVKEVAAAEFKRQQQARVDAEKTAALEIENNKKIAAQQIKDRKALLAERRADNQKTADLEIANNKKIFIARIREAELILAEAKKLETPFERVFQANLKITRAQADQKQQMVLVTAQGEKQVGIYAQALNILRAEEAALARVNAVPLARTKAAQDGTDAQNLKVIKLKALREVAAQEFKDAQKVRADNKKTAALEIEDNKKIAAQQRKDRKKRLAERRAERAKEQAERLQLINQERAARLKTRTPVVQQRLTTSTAGKQEINTFLQAETAAKKFAATGVAAFKQVDAAIAQARAGTLKFSGNLTQAEAAALKLVAAEKQVAIGANQAAAASKGIFTSVKNLGNLIGISLLIGGAFRLVTAFTDAARAAGELSIKIAEIETISAAAARSTEEWAVDLRELSNQFGIDTLKQAEGAYQILSRQIKNASGAVIQGAEALKFLEVANKLATVGVTDTATATNLLTSTMNAFKIPAEQAEIIAAKLFKTVELGALRIENIADIMGRVAVPASQLGLSLEEVLGSIDGLTRQGFKADEAITGIRNVILKLVKPTNAGKEALKSLGAETGKALIQARGFIPALTAFIEELGNTVEGTAKGFGRIRAIVGALGLTGENAQDAADSIRDIKAATLESFGGDLEKVLQSTGKQLEIFKQQAVNLFEKELGTAALKAIVELIKEFGGMEKILEDTISVMKLTGAALFRIAQVSLLVAKNFKVVAFAFGAAFAAQKLLLLQATFKGLGVLEGVAYAAALAYERLEGSVIATNLALLASPLGVGLALATVFAGLTELHKQEAQRQLEIVEASNQARLKSNIKLAESTKAAQAKVTSDLQNEVSARTSAYLRFSQDIIAQINEKAGQLVKRVKETGREAKELLKGVGKAATAEINVAKKAFKSFTKDAETAAKTIQSILRTEDKAQFSLDLNTAGFGPQIGLLETEIQKAREAVQAATADGNIKEFNLQRKRLNELVKQRIEAEVSVAKEQSKINQELEDARIQRRKATTHEERQLADERIASLRRQSLALKEGNASQLKQERDLEKIRDQGRTAKDAAAFKAALDSLSALKREQQRLNVLAVTERTIRAQTALEAAKQAKQAVEILEINKQRAAEARKEEQRVSALQFKFTLIRKEAEAFKSERVSEGETATEINKAVAEQQRRFAKLITLSRELSGGASLDPIFSEQSANLREQAQVRIDKVEELAKQKRLLDIKTELNAKLAATATISKKEDDLFKRRRQSIAAVSQLRNLEVEGTGGGGFGIRRALGEQPSANDSADLNETAETQFTLLIKQFELLNKLVADQTKGFTEERQGSIERLVSGIKGSLDPKALARGREDVSQQRRSGELNRNRAVSEQGLRDLQDINQTLTAARDAAHRIANSTEFAGQNIAERQSLIEQLDNFAETSLKDSTESIKEELTAREKHTKALDDSQKLINEFNNLTTGGGRALADTDASIPRLTPKYSVWIPSVEKATSTGVNEGLEGTAEKVAEQYREGTREGLKQGQDDNITNLEAQAKKAAEAQTKARSNQSAELLKQIDAAERNLKSRRDAAISRAGLGASSGATPSAPKLPKVDRTIRLGQGAPSIASQQARIEAADAKNRKAQEKFRETLDAFKKEERERKSIGVRPGAQIPGVPRPGTQIGPRPGTQIGPRPGTFKQGGEGPTQQKQLTASEQTAANTKVLADSALGLGVTSRAQAGTPESRVKPELLAQLGRGQAEADAELTRITKQRVQAAAKVALTDEKIRTLQLQRADISFLFVEESEKALAEIKRQRILRKQLNGPIQPPNDPGSSRDALTRGLSASSRPPEGLLAQTQGLGVTRVGSTGLRPQGDVTNTTNVGGISLTVNESENPQQTMQQLATALNRGLRNGTIKFRSK